MTEDCPTYKAVAEPKMLFCKQCRAPKAADRKYCSYCVGRHKVENSSFRVRMAYRFLPSQWKFWFIFHVGHDVEYEVLIPEHLRAVEWLDIEQMSAPIEVDEE